MDLKLSNGITITVYVRLFPCNVDTMARAPIQSVAQHNCKTGGCHLCHAQPLRIKVGNGESTIYASPKPAKFRSHDEVIAEITEQNKKGTFAQGFSVLW